MNLAIKILQQLLTKKKTFKKILNLKKVSKWWSQRSDIGRNKQIEDGKRIGIDEIIKQNEKLNNNLKSQV